MLNFLVAYLKVVAEQYAAVNARDGHILCRMARNRVQQDNVMDVLMLVAAALNVPTTVVNLYLVPMGQVRDNGAWAAAKRLVENNIRNLSQTEVATIQLIEAACNEWVADYKAASN